MTQSSCVVMNPCTRTTPTAVLDVTPGVRDAAGSPDTHHLMFAQADSLPASACPETLQLVTRPGPALAVAVSCHHVLQIWRRPFTSLLGNNAPGILTFVHALGFLSKDCRHWG